MIISLSIRDFVLIERLDLQLERGLTALTGETGAGKSIMLGALGLALGGRAERSMVRAGAARCTVTAEFDVQGRGDVVRLLDEHGLNGEERLVLRRSVSSDGRSRAFVNDQPVGVALLRQIADLLVEVHGQQEQQSLLEPAMQRMLLDAHGGLEPLALEVGRLHAGLRTAEAVLAEQRASLGRAAEEEAYLRHVTDEIAALAPQPGEEAALVEARSRLMNREKLVRAIGDALRELTTDGGVQPRLGSALRQVERALGDAAELLAPAAAALERAGLELAEALEALERAGQTLEHGSNVEQIEERLFALRAVARKHRVEVDRLEPLRVEMAARLADIDARADRLQAAERNVAEARGAFQAKARQLAAARAVAATRLQDAVMAELPPLRLERARFRIALVPLSESLWGSDGNERVAFEVATNPGQEPGPLQRIASGGELARLMLALKVVLARAGSRPCLIFDEVDTGIGGATAAAVGERLARLGENLQVLVVTHAPQVAARAHHHLRIEKHAGRHRAGISVAGLGPEQRREEIARMLAGARITEAARAAAASLMTQSV